MNDKEEYGFLKQVDIKCSVIYSEDYMLYRVYMPAGVIVEIINTIAGTVDVHYSDSKRTIVVEHDGRVLRVPYETNRIININENRAYIAICERDNRRYLFLSKRFCYNKNVIRSSYFGLTPELFYISMFIENTCDVEDDMGNSYRIWVKE